MKNYLDKAKKVFWGMVAIIIITALTSCTCLAQMHTQFYFANDSCEFYLPDYSQAVEVRDNCCVDSTGFYQTPPSGTRLSPGNDIVVTLHGRDCAGNTISMQFDVVVIDNVPPYFWYDSTHYEDGDPDPDPAGDTIVEVYSNDFDHLTAGSIYLTAEWEVDYPDRPPWYYSFAKQSNSRIVNATLDGITSQYLRYWIGEDTDYGDSDHGIDFKGWFDADSTGYKELYYSYDWYIPGGQNFLGWTESGKTGTLTEGTGKIPSAGGWYWYTQDLTHSFPYYDEGFSAGIRWKSDAAGTNLYLTTYLYTHNLMSVEPYAGVQGVNATVTFKDPDNWPSVYLFPNGEWHNITIRIVMNDVDPQVPEEDWNQNNIGDGEKNGIYEVFIDGKLSVSIDTLIWRNIPDMGGVDVMKMYTMSNRYQDEDIYWYTDNFHYWYTDSAFAEQNNIPWGNTETYIEGDTLYFPKSWSHVGFGY